MVPEGLVLLTSVAFAASVVRLGRQQVLVQELPAVETLARVDVICLDKTGTITAGDIAFSDLEPLGDEAESTVASALAGLAASDPNPNATLNAIGRAPVVARAAAEGTWDARVAVPFSSARKWSGSEFEEHGTWLLGAPEVLLAATAEGTDGPTRTRVDELARQGRRVVLLARTDPDRSKTHRGLSMFVVPKPRGEGHGFELSQAPGDHGGAPGGGKMEGRPIDTIGYRGMHSYEIALDNWFVAAENQVGGEEGLGKGFYFQMEGFENGRLQTAARAVGLMQAAYEDARQYAQDRVVFGQPIADYQLTQVKLGRMAFTIQAARQFSYVVARMMAKGEGALEASMVKAYVCKAAEWVTREAMQIHGGFGYAEEYPVSRYFVDARVLSIFEGADETLCLKVIARRLLESADA